MGLVTDLSPEKFNQKFETISSQSLGSFLVVDDEGIIDKTDFFSFLWEKIKGIFGARDRSSKELVQLSLMNFIEYGTKNKFLNEKKLPDIQNIALKAGLITPSDKNDLEKQRECSLEEPYGYRFIHLVSADILNNTQTTDQQEREINQYYDEQKNRITNQENKEMFERIKWLFTPIIRVEKAEQPPEPEIAQQTESPSPEMTTAQEKVETTVPVSVPSPEKGPMSVEQTAVPGSVPLQEEATESSEQISTSLETRKITPLMIAPSPEKQKTIEEESIAAIEKEAAELKEEKTQSINKTTLFALSLLLASAAMAVVYGYPTNISSSDLSRNQPQFPESNPLTPYFGPHFNPTLTNSTIHHASSLNLTDFSSFSEEQERKTEEASEPVEQIQEQKTEVASKPQVQEQKTEVMTTSEKKLNLENVAGKVQEAVSEAPVKAETSAEKQIPKSTQPFNYELISSLGKPGLAVEFSAEVDNYFRVSDSYAISRINEITLKNAELISKHYQEQEITTGQEALEYTDEHANRFRQFLIEKKLVTRAPSFWEGKEDIIEESKIEEYIKQARELVGILNSGIQKNIVSARERDEILKKDGKQATIADIRAFNVKDSSIFKKYNKVLEHFVEEKLIIPTSWGDLRWSDGHKNEWIQC